jgi:trehalose/maltose hydrolase-like predicted phosphorylase
MAADATAAALALPSDPAWCLVAPQYQPALEHDVESRLAISNGVLGVRAALEQPTGASRPHTFVAGIFDTPGNPSAVPALVPGPDWLRLGLLVEGEPLALDRGQTLTHTRTLDLRRGVLISDWRQRDVAGRIVTLRTLRFVSLANRALAVQVAWIAVDQPTALTLEASFAPLEGGLLPTLRGPDVTVWRTVQSARRLALANTATLCVDGTVLRWDAIAHGARRWCWAAVPDQMAIFARIIAVARGNANDDPSGSAQATVHCRPYASWPPLLAAHERAWADRWAETDVTVEGDDLAQQALRFASYHLISAANPHDEHTSIGARALTGDAYLGHVFWDTEIFLLPFYTFTWPAAARALLMYRYHTLPAARAKAARLGYRGALYAWESADTGDEATPPYAVGPDGQVVAIRCGTDEQHISADVAYAVWQYWQATEDRAFLLNAGAEILLETARFWASRAQLEADGQYHIRHVIGPDEYHEEVDDNAYTNGMAQWNLERALEVAQLVQERWPLWWARLNERLQLTPAELDVWRDVAARLVTGLNATTGRFEQFAGFFDLEPVDLAIYEPRSVPMDVLLGRERTQQSQVSKQADVVMLLALLWERYPSAVRATNFRYYEPRCGHGSSLSPPIHALVAARLGEVELAERYFCQTAAIDQGGAVGTTALGVHIGALGGLWQAAVFGFAGLSLCPDGLSFDPHLPRSWRALRFPIHWRGRLLQIELRQVPSTLIVTLVCGEPLVVRVGAYSGTVRPGQRWSSCLGTRDQQWREVAR